jgi:hypothetical protein
VTYRLPATAAGRRRAAAARRYNGAMSIASALPLTDLAPVIEANIPILVLCSFPGAALLTHSYITYDGLCVTSFVQCVCIIGLESTWISI